MILGSCNCNSLEQRWNVIRNSQGFYITLLHDTHIVLILSCLFGACWYFPADVPGECPSLVLFDHFSSASTVESAVPSSTSSSCPFALQLMKYKHKQFGTLALKRLNRPPRFQRDLYLEFVKLSSADEAIIVKLPQPAKLILSHLNDTTCYIYGLRSLNVMNLHNFLPQLHQSGGRSRLIVFLS